MKVRDAERVLLNVLCSPIDTVDARFTESVRYIDVIALPTDAVKAADALTVW